MLVLERVLIAVAAVLAVTALVGLIHFDIGQNAAGDGPATPVGGIIREPFGR
jgi:hypothetical protein